MQVEGEAPTLHSVSREPTLGTGRRQPVTSPHGGGAELEGHDAQAEGAAPALNNVSGEPPPGTERLSGDTPAGTGRVSGEPTLGTGREAGSCTRDAEQGPARGLPQLPLGQHEDCHD